MTARDDAASRAPTYLARRARRPAGSQSGHIELEKSADLNLQLHPYPPKNRDRPHNPCNCLSLRVPEGPALSPVEGSKGA